VWVFVFGAVCGVAMVALVMVGGHVHRALRGHRGAGGGGTARAHTEEKFAFTANAPMERVAPLFGADKERVWAPGWSPQFVYPVPAADQQGMVFNVAHDHLHATWVNTLFDLKNGRIQYVYMIPDALVTVVDLQLTQEGQQTKVAVQYTRTALSAEAEAHVRHLAEGDAKSGPEWEKQVNGWLGKSSNQ
jgi:hypothetical protein